MNDIFWSMRLCANLFGSYVSVRGRVRVLIGIFVLMCVTGWGYQRLENAVAGDEVSLA